MLSKLTFLAATSIALLGGACYQDDAAGPAGGMPVAAVVVGPASANLAVGDSVSFNAQPRDSAGLPLNRPVSWFTTDGSVFVIERAAGFLATIRARRAGSAFLRATSEGKVGQATVTVN
jgi:hypothetical protein